MASVIDINTRIDAIAFKRHAWLDVILKVRFLKFFLFGFICLTFIPGNAFFEYPSVSEGAEYNL